MVLKQEQELPGSVFQRSHIAGWTKLGRYVAGISTTTTDAAKAYCG